MTMTLKQYQENFKKQLLEALEDQEVKEQIKKLIFDTDISTLGSTVQGKVGELLKIKLGKIL
jgi:hypothetical protein